MTGVAAQLIEAARAVAKFAHAPYSGFGVGAAVLLDDGAVVTGCNFENASYGLTLCAETIALGTVNAQGKLRHVREIGIIGGKLEKGSIAGHDIIYPCGRCRQVINEAAQMSNCDIMVHCASADGVGHESHALSSLLPYPFGPHNLGIK